METHILSNTDIILRLGAAALIGMALGVERAAAHKTAGMRTYALVSLGAAAFVAISEMLAVLYPDVRGFDPSRIASQVVVGIGFIGAGLIIFHENKIQGLTTAAGLWVAAGIGAACGYGLYTLGVISALIALAIFTIGGYLEYPIRELKK